MAVSVCLVSLERCKTEVTPQTDQFIFLYTVVSLASTFTLVMALFAVCKDYIKAEGLERMTEPKDTLC